MCSHATPRLLGSFLLAIDLTQGGATPSFSHNQLSLLMGFYKLPQEVLDLIVDFSVSESLYPREDTTMQTCALVSRSLTARAQRHIFKQVRLFAVKDFLIFESKLISSPRLGTYTTTLLVALGDRRWLQPDESPSSSRKLETLYRILQACPHMEHLRVLVDQTMSPLHMASLGLISTLRALRHIGLIGAFGGEGGLSYRVFETFCSLAQTLDVLELSSMELTLDESGPKAFALPSVKRLEMTLVADEGSFICLTEMLEGSLEELVVNLSKVATLYWAVRLVSALGYRLRYLSITGLTDGKHYLRPIVEFTTLSLTRSLPQTSLRPSTSPHA